MPIGRFDTWMIYLLPTQGKICMELIQGISLRFGSVIKELFPVINHGCMIQKEIQNIYILMINNIFHTLMIC